MNTTTTTSRRNHKLFLLALSVAILGALAWFVNQYVSLEELAQQEQRIRNYIDNNSLSAFLIGFSIYTALALVPGTGGKAIVSGWLFGFWQAMTIVTVGLTVAAMVIFSLSRYLIRDAIERHYSSFLTLMNRHLAKEGAFYLLTLRMAHAPYSIVNPVSGASRVSSWTFFWTTVIGLLPANVIWIYVGISLPSLIELAQNGPEAFLSLPLLVALISCALLPLLIRWIVNHFGSRDARADLNALVNDHENDEEDSL